MAWCIDEIDSIELSILGLVLHACSVKFDGDTALAFQVHAIEVLRLHVPVFDGVGFDEQLVCEGGFAVVYVGYDADVSIVLWGDLDDLSTCVGGWFFYGGRGGGGGGAACCGGEATMAWW